MSDPERNPAVDQIAFRSGRPCEGGYRDLQDYSERGTYLYLTEMTVHRVRRSFPTIYYPAAVPDYPRASLEDTINALEWLPAPELFKTVLVVDHVHPYEPWLRQANPESSVPTATHADDSVQIGSQYSPWVLLFRPEPSQLRQNLLREWFRQLRFHDADLAARYRMVAEEVGPIGLLKKGWEDEWVALGSDLFSEQGDAAVLEKCILLSLRCAVLGYAVESTLLASDEPERALQSAWFSRATFVRFSAANAALKQIRERVLTLPTDEKGAGLLKMLEGLAKPSQGAPGRRL